MKHIQESWSVLLDKNCCKKEGWWTPKYVKMGCVRKKYVLNRCPPNRIIGRVTPEKTIVGGEEMG